MRRVLVVALFALALGAGAAKAADIGVGVFAGSNIPIVQDDNGNGIAWGIRVPVRLIPMLTVEPYFGSTTGGEKEQDVSGIGTITRDGIDITSYGVTGLLTFGAGLQFYPYASIGSGKMSRDGSEDLSGVEWGAGLGLGISPMPKLSVHLRGGIDVITKDDITRDFALVTGGVSYSFLSFPPVP